MKKTIAISFLLFAGTILLAHAVIFHHHPNDGQFVCESNSHCCHGDIDDCSLENVYVKFDNDKQIFQSQDFNFDRLPCFLTLFLIYPTPPIVSDIGLPFRQKPYLSSFHTEYITQSTGLRAPPF